MNLRDWNEILFSYCSANAYAPEELKAAIIAKPAWGKAFHETYRDALRGGMARMTWGREAFGFGHPNDEAFRDWLEALRAHLFEGAPEPRPDGQS